MSRYVLCKADLSGTEDQLQEFDKLGAALTLRDYFRGLTDKRSAHFRVIDTEDPECGDLDWDSAEAGP